MKVTCIFTFPGQPELDVGRTLWSFICASDEIRCVMDGDAIGVAVLYRNEEVPLAEVGIGLWRNREVLAEIFASYAAYSGENYRSRLKVFRQKNIVWLGD